MKGYFLLSGLGGKPFFILKRFGSSPDIATIESEVAAFYGDSAQRFDDPCAIDDQFSFLRFFIEIEEGTVLKVELLQNMKNLYEIEMAHGVRLLSKKDIGLFKLVSAASRSSQKDIYELDFITNDIPLVTLYDALVLKIKPLIGQATGLFLT